MNKGYMQLFIYLCRNDNYKISEERDYMPMIKIELMIDSKALKLGLALV